MRKRCNVTALGIDKVKHIIGVHSGKGGVGKSTIATNLALALAHREHAVGLLDADIHGPSVGSMLGNRDWPKNGPLEHTIYPLEAHGIKCISMDQITDHDTPVIWRGAMVHGMIEQFLQQVFWGDLDYLIIDLPPGTGDAQISLAQLVPLDGIVVVTTPQELSIVDTLRGMMAFRKLGVPLLGLVENMSYFECPETGQRDAIFGESDPEAIAQQFDMPFLGQIPLEPIVREGSDDGKPIMTSDRETPAKQVMREMAVAVEQQVAQIQQWHQFKVTWNDTLESRHEQPPSEPNAPTSLPIKALWQVDQHTLGLQWHDDRVDILSVQRLRQACPCAHCVDEWSGRPLLDPESVKADLKLVYAKAVGRYALRFEFSDKHQDGIYHWTYMRELGTP